jgi:hypothetical protein
MNYKAKSVVFGRKPRRDGDDFKSAFFKLYDILDPLGQERFPIEELDFSNIEKVELRGENLDYFLEGNDLVIDNISEVIITQDGTKLLIQTKK